MHIQVNYSLIRQGGTNKNSLQSAQLCRQAEGSSIHRTCPWSDSLSSFPPSSPRRLFWLRLFLWFPVPSPSSPPTSCRCSLEEEEGFRCSWTAWCTMSCAMATWKPILISITSNGSTLMRFWFSKQTFTPSLTSVDSSWSGGLGSHNRTTLSIPLLASMGTLGCHWTQFTMDSSPCKTLTRFPLSFSQINMLPSSLPAAMYSPCSPMKLASLMSVCVLQWPQNLVL